MANSLLAIGISRTACPEDFVENESMAQICNLAPTAALTFAMCGLSSAFGQPPSPAEFLTAMRSSLAELAVMERQMPSFGCRFTVSQNQKQLSERVIRVWRYGDQILFEMGNGNKRGGLNADYMFGIERKDQTRPWSLVQIELANRVSEFHKNLGNFHQVVFPLTAMGSKDRIEMVNNPNFRVVATRSGPAGVIEADFTSEESTRMGPVGISGTITVSAKRPGLILAYHHTTLTGPRPIKFTMTPKYDEINSRLQCKSLNFELAESMSGNVFQNEAYEFFDYGADPVDRSEFYLSHYGLPEPMGVESKKPTPRYVWFLIAAGTTATIAVGLRLLARRGASVSKK